MTATEVYSFANTVPAGTAVAAGWSTPMTMPPRNVERVDILVPPGPRGQVGFYLGSAGTQIVPVNPGQYLITDDEKLSFDLSDTLTSGAWVFYGYNLGRLPHTVYVRFSVTLPYGPGQGGGSSLIPGALLSS